MPTLLDIVFATAATLLWVSVFGYLLLLATAARFRRRARGAARELPAVTVVLATRDEESLIADKLDDLLRTAYPSDRIRFLVVDGGSQDRTVEIVRARIAGGDPFELFEIAATSKSDQIDAALAHVRTDIVVTTDADARLAIDCVRRLAAELAADPQLGAVAAAVEPATDLVEERLHWRMQNLLWWAEGEVFGAAMGSGVALAFRRAAVSRVPHGITADDAYVMMRAAAHGGARLCPQAVARELRVPHSFAEFLAFRRRRGRGYRVAVERFALGADAPAGARLAWAIRRWHFRFFPAVTGATAAAGFAVACTPSWPLAVAAAAIFAVSLWLVARRALVGPGSAAGSRMPLAALRALVFDGSVLIAGTVRPRPRSADPR